MPVLEHKNYRDYLREQVVFNEKVRGYQNQLASVAKCQKSVISQVLYGKIDLNLDQGVLLSQFWRLSDFETRYWLLLISIARAGTRELRNVLEKQAEEMRAAHEDLAFRFKEAQLSTEEMQIRYYSKWQVAAIHVALSIPQLRAPVSLSKKLGIPINSVMESLNALQSLGLIERNGNEFKQTESYIHLPKDSPLTLINHLNWRHRAIESINQNESSNLHFSSVFSCSKSDFELIKQNILDSIDQFRKTVKSSSEEEMYVLNCDLFRF